ncbi:VOC family protein [bacterium]|nr:MAG: VOC family protein [bacterium]
MIQVEGVYEVAVRVRDLSRAETFYRDVLGLEVGLRDTKRPWVFLRVGPSGMIVLQEDPGEWPLQHFAFKVSEATLDRAVDFLAGKEIATEGPVSHDWIPAR